MTALLQCPSCSAQVASDSRFCSSCGRAMLSLSQAPTAAPVAGAAIAVARLVSSDSIPVGGFTPGTIMADRYRIIGLLGRGGMGEVYRADDLKLGQPVVLRLRTRHPRRFRSHYSLRLPHLPGQPPASRSRVGRRLVR